MYRRSRGLSRFLTCVLARCVCAVLLLALLKTLPCLIVLFVWSSLTISICQPVPGIQDLDCCGADRDGSAANLAHRFDLPDDAQARPMKGLKKGGFLSKTTLTGFFFFLIRFYCSHSRLFKSIFS